MKCENCLQQTTKTYKTPEYEGINESFDLCEHCAYTAHIRSTCNCNKCTKETMEKIIGSLRDYARLLKDIDTADRSPNQVSRYIYGVQEDLDATINYLEEVVSK